MTDMENKQIALMIVLIIAQNMLNAEALHGLLWMVILIILAKKYAQFMIMPIKINSGKL